MIVKSVNADMSVKLFVVQGRPFGKALLFPVGEYYFGRGPECHVRPDSEWVSRQHCLLRVTTDAVFVRDLGSRNGTLVNGVLLTEERQLLQGDQVQIGPLVFEVHLESTVTTEALSRTPIDAATLGGGKTTEVETMGAKQPRGADESTETQPALPSKPVPLVPRPPKSDTKP